MTDESVYVIRYSTLIKADAPAVWEAISTGAGWDSWFTSGTTIEPRAGGRLHLVWRGLGPDLVDAEDHGRVLSADPDRELVFSWNSPPSRVRMTLSPHAEGTRLDLVEDELPEGEAGIPRLMDCSCGWGEALTLLKFWVEHGVAYR